ncbi:uncharacterized protein LOC131977210 [Centropristis striata]|uniref:uncharacterized protein LOC131977210 n=1 Tax=Centropristis striata TaxID=184440 RepID=UPI0027DEEB80|nr:uncharacterized protein LOC131977210 [Centropristis striata]
MEIPFNGRPSCHDLEDGTSQNQSDNTASPATASSSHQTVAESVWTKKRQEEETRQEEERPERDSQPCVEETPRSEVSVSTTTTPSTPASGILIEHQTDINTADRSEADQPSDGLSGSVSESLTSVKETSSAASQSDQQQCENQSVTEQDEDKRTSAETQTVSDDHEHQTNTQQDTFTKKTDRKEERAAREQRTQTEHSAAPCSAVKETIQSTQAAESNEETASGRSERQQQHPESSSPLTHSQQKETNNTETHFEFQAPQTGSAATPTNVKD